MAHTAAVTITTFPRYLSEIDIFQALPPVTTTTKSETYLVIPKLTLTDPDPEETALGPTACQRLHWASGTQFCIQAFRGKHLPAVCKTPGSSEHRRPSRGETNRGHSRRGEHQAQEKQKQPRIPCGLRSWRSGSSWFSSRAVLGTGSAHTGDPLPELHPQPVPNVDPSHEAQVPDHCCFS